MHAFFGSQTLLSRLRVSLVVVAGVLLVTAVDPATSSACSQTANPGHELDGTSGADFLCGTSSNDLIKGLGGDDRLDGLAGGDDLQGGTGNDEINGGDGDDIITGGSGNDNLGGGDGNDDLTGNSGDDTFSGDAGNDRLFMRDGALELHWDCGGGIDHLDMDLVDFAPVAATAGLLLVLRSCESVTVGAVREGPNVVISSRSLRVKNGRTAVRLHCPGSLDINCTGRLRLPLATKASFKRKHPATRYSIRRGRSRTVPVRLASRDERTLKNGARGVIESVEKGHFGHKTTTRTVGLRVRH